MSAKGKTDIGRTVLLFHKIYHILTLDLYSPRFWLLWPCWCALIFSDQQSNTNTSLPVEEYEKWVPLGIQRPEGIAYINSSHPSSEILGESAAALAATSVIYFSVDQAYSTRCLEAAKDLYNRGSTNLGTYMTSKDPNMQTLKEWYPSSIYTDELGWAASWLYVATKDSKYLDAANGWIAKSSDHSNEVTYLLLCPKYTT